MVFNMQGMVCVHTLIRIKILPNVWHQCELDLADIRAKRLLHIFGWDKQDE